MFAPLRQNQVNKPVTRLIGDRKMAETACSRGTGTAGERARGAALGARTTHTTRCRRQVTLHHYYHRQVLRCCYFMAILLCSLEIDYNYLVPADGSSEDAHAQTPVAPLTNSDTDIV